MILYVASATALSYGHPLWLKDRFISNASNASSIILFLNSWPRSVLYRIRHNTDAGFQYTSPAFVKKLEKAGMVQSMSRVGKCLYNGPMEAFWGILKCEAYFARTFETREDLITAIDQWLHYYMYERPQRRFDLKTPYEVRKAALEAEEPVIYKIPENKRIERYKKEHYKNNTIRNCAIPSACPYANQLLTL